MKDIGQKVATGAAWMMLLKLVERGIGLVSILILARLLTPADFGLVAMAMSVVALTELMSAFGFDTAIIQRQGAGRAHFDTAWTFGVLFGAGIALLLLALAIPAAAFYREPRLQEILPVLAIGALVQGFQNIGIVTFRKELDFRREFAFLLSKRIVSFVVTVALALSFRSYWALVVGIVSGKCLSVWISYLIHPYRPCFTFTATKDLFNFSKWLFISNLVLFLQNKSADFILGRTVGAQGLGLYNVAFEIAVLPSTELIAPLNRAVFPAYAQLATDLAELRRMFLQIFSIIALVAFPVSTGLACIAERAVLAVLGPQWSEAVVLLRIFTIAGLIGALQSNLHIVIVALGKPKANTIVSAGTLLISLPIFIVTTIHYGTVGAASTYLIFAFIGLVTIHFVFFRITGINVREYFSTMSRPILCTAVMAFALVVVERFINTDAAESSLFILISLVLIGATTYVASILALWWVAGKPKAAETYILEFMSARLGHWAKIIFRPSSPGR